MADVMAAIEAAIRDVDPALAERYQVPIKPGEHVIGVLGDLSRRLLALQTLAFQQHGKLLMEAAHIREDPTLRDGDEIVIRWIMNSRMVRARIAMLKGLWRFAAYEQFPEAIAHDILVVRAGSTLVWCEQFDEELEKRVGSAVGEIFASRPDPEN